MRILFDQGTPLPLQKALAHHQIETAFRKGWAELKNGDLISAAEIEFDALITSDKNLKYQQRVTGRKLAILVLPTNVWPILRAREKEIAEAVDRLKPGDYVEIT